MNNKPAATLNGIDEVFKQINNSAKPDWLSQYRKTNFERYKTAGLPTTKDEDWKYTSIKPVLETQYHLPSGKTDSIDVLKDFIDANDLNIVFINGVWNKEYSNLGSEKSLIIENLDTTLRNSSDNLKDILQKHTHEKENTFLSLNNALLSNGIYIKVPANKIVQKLIHIVHITTKESADTIINNRTIIHLEKSSQATVMESHVTTDDNSVYLANPVTDNFIEENATLSYYKVQRESLSGHHISNTRVWQANNSNYENFSFMNGGKIARNNLDITLNGEGSSTILKGLYCLSGEQLTDNHTSIDHRFPHCTSNQLYKGVLNDSSRAVFNGKIFVQPIAQLTNSYQLNKNLLLGKNCRVDTKPQLEIFADDVKCTHGATIGKLNENELFYLQTRGISRPAAIKMLATGFIDQLLNEIKNPKIIQRIHKLLEPSFAQH